MSRGRARNRKPKSPPPSFVPPTPDETLPHRVFAFLEHPLFLTPVGIVGGLIGLLIYGPVLVVCGLCILLAFHRSGVVRGRPRWIQCTCFAALSLVAAFGLVAARQLVRKDTPHFASASEIADALKQVLPGASDRTAPAAPPISSNELDEVNKLRAMVDGRDETGLRDEFGLPLMAELNIGIVRDRLVHFRQTGDNSLSLIPYLDGGKRKMMIDTEIAHLGRQGGDGFYVPQANEVGLIVLPEEYSTGKDALLEFEQSSVLPSSVRAAVKGLDDAVTENAKTLLKVLNNALHENPDYFVHYDDMASPYVHELRHMCLLKFVDLEPEAEKVRHAVRDSLGLK